MLKPRLVDRGWRMHEIRWVCKGYGAYGWGDTAQEAYKKWRKDRKDKKASGLLRARTKRKFAEKRIKDREARRIASAEAKRTLKVAQDMANCPISSAAAYKETNYTTSEPFWKGLFK